MAGILADVGYVKTDLALLWMLRSRGIADSVYMEAVRSLNGQVITHEPHALHPDIPMRPENVDLPEDLPSHTGQFYPGDVPTRARLRLKTLYLGPGILYSSGWSEAVVSSGKAMRGIPANTPSICLDGHLPETLIMAIRGMKLKDIVRHEALHPDIEVKDVVVRKTETILLIDEKLGQIKHAKPKSETNQ